MTDPFELVLIDPRHGPRCVRLRVEGPRVIRRFGLVEGDPGQWHERRERYADPAEATAALHRAVGRLLVRGYTLGAEHPGLLAAIAAAPEQPEGYQVYADWLLDHGDPRAELITVALGLDLDPDDPALVDQHEQLRARHAIAWTRPGWDRLDLVWRLGFVAGLRWRFRSPVYAIPAELADPRPRELPRASDLALALWSVRRHPSGRLLRWVDLPDSWGRVFDDGRGRFAVRFDPARGVVTVEPPGPTQHDALGDARGG